MLLIDEVDKTDVEVEGLLLEVLSDFQVTIPELGTLAAVRRPFVVLTSNATRELSEALKRRCLYLHLDYPDAEREREIVLSQVPDLDERLAEQLVATVARLRELELKKPPSIAESVDWARTLIALEIRDLDDEGGRRHARRRPQARLRPGARGPRAAAAQVLRRHEQRPGRPPHRLPRGAARGRHVGVAGRGPRRGRRALARCRGTSAQTVRAAYAATLVKKQSQRPTFDALFDVYFPRLVGEGVAGDGRRATSRDGQVRDNGQALADFRELLAEALADGDQEALARLAVEMVGRFGAMPGRGPGLSSWSAYTALQRVSPGELVDRIVAGAARRRAGPRRRRRRSPGGGSAASPARSRTTPAAGSPRRRGPTTSPTSRSGRASTGSTSPPRARRDLEEMRREIYPLARRLATRLTKEHHARRRGPLDFRRTVRASISTGGVPLATHHRPKRPHRTELVVLCDVSGSVANFAQFTLLLVFALRDQFQKVRAFTFIDHVHEVTEHFKPGADVVDVLADLAASTSHAALWGRTNYGRAFTKFAEEHADALGPKVVAADPRRRPLQLQRPRARQLQRAGAARPGTPGGSTPSTAGTGTPATRPPGSTARSSRWSSAATSPSSASSCTTSSSGGSMTASTQPRCVRRAVVRPPLPGPHASRCGRLGGRGPATRDQLGAGAEFSERRAVLPSRAVDELPPRDPGDGAGEPDRLQERGEGMGTAAGIAAVRPACNGGSDGVAGGRGAGSEHLPVVARSLTTSTTRRRAVRRRRDAPVARPGRRRDRRRPRSPSRRSCGRPASRW